MSTPPYVSRGSMTDLVDPEAGSTVVNGSFGSFLAGAVGGIGFARFRAQGSVIPIAARSALNAGVFGTVFFHLREYALVPALNTAIPARRQQYADNFTPTWGDMRANKLLESSFAGAAAGVVNNIIARRASGTILSLSALRSTAFAGAVFCPLAQYIVNETRVLRVKWTGGRVDSATSTPQTQQESLERIKDALSMLAPVQRGPQADARALDRLQKEKQEMESRLEAVREKLRDGERGAGR